MKFPTTSGISAHVFKKKFLYYSNNASKETKFVEEIDNQSFSGTDVKNFMIGPVFGPKNQDVPCAIIQFINKIDLNNKKNKLGWIDEKDERMFQSLANLMGMCIENTNDLSNTIKMSFDIKEVMGNI